MLNQHDTAGGHHGDTPTEENNGKPNLLSGLSNVWSYLAHRRQDVQQTLPQTETVFADADHMLVGPNIRDHRIMCIGDLTSPIWDHFDWLGGVAVSVTASTDPMAGLARATKFPSNRLLLLCDIDAFGPLEQAVEGLAQFRRLNSNVTVVIGSKGFRGHDFTVERALIADASVKLPLSKVTLGLVLGAAITNHRVIQARSWSGRPSDLGDHAQAT